MSNFDGLPIKWKLRHWIFYKSQKSWANIDFLINGAPDLIGGFLRGAQMTSRSVIWRHDVRFAFRFQDVFLLSISCFLKFWSQLHYPKWKYGWFRLYRKCIEIQGNRSPFKFRPPVFSKVRHVWSWKFHIMRKIDKN